MPGLRSLFIYPTTLAFGTALAVVVGTSSPVAGANAMTVTIFWPGASAADVDGALATPLSRAVLGVPGLTRLEVESHAARCSAVIRFGPHVDARAVAQAVLEAITKAAPTLPVDCGPAQIVSGYAGELAALWIGVKSDRATNEAITGVARRLIRDDLAQLEGTARVELVGAVNGVPTLWLDAERLAALHLTAGDVSRAVRDAPARIGAELGDIIVRADDGKPIRARDVARFEHAIHENGFAAVDGVRCVLVTIATRAGKPNVAAVEKELARIRARLPAGMTADLVADVSGDGAVLIETAFPPETRPAEVRRTADAVAQRLRTMAPKSACIAFSTGDADKVRFLLGPGKDRPNPADFRWRLAEIPGMQSRVCELAGGSLFPFPARVALSGPDRKNLKQWSDAVIARLNAENIVLDPAAFPGTDALTVKVSVDRKQAAALGVTMAHLDDEIALASGSAAVAVAGGQRVEIRLDNRIQPADRLAHTTIRSNDGKLVPLMQIAKVETIAEPASAWRVNSWEAIRISATAPPGASSAAAAARMIAIAEAEREKLKLTEGYHAMDLSPAE